MREKLFVVCDSDEAYLERLQRYLQKKNLVDFRLMVFGSLEEAREYNSCKEFEIMLLNEMLYTEEVESMRIGKLFLLREKGVLENTEYPMLAKYQSAENLLSSILDSYAKDESCKCGMHYGKNETKLITFYSPDCQANQTMAVLAAGQVLSEKNKVLYLNLIPFSGLEKLLRSSYEADLSDFVYFALKHSDKLAYKLGGIKRSIGELEYIPPVRNYTDLLQIEEGQWEQVLDALLHIGDYHQIIVETSECCQGLERLLDRSDKIYTMYGKSDVSQARIEEYKRFCIKKGRENILEKTCFIQEPDEWKDKHYDYVELGMAHPGKYMKGRLYEDGFR